MRTRSSLAILTSALLTLSGCGGGSNGTAGLSTAAPDTTSTAAAVLTRAAQPADTSKSFADFGSLSEAAETIGTAKPLAVKLTVPATTSTANLAYSFDAPFASLSPGWWVNWWGSQPPNYAAHQETRSDYVSVGAGAQMFRLNSVAPDGDAQLAYTFGFAKDTRYTVGVQLRADAPSRVRVQFRMDDWPYTEVASKVIDVGNTWQRVEVSGQYLWQSPGSIRIIPVTLGTNLYLDNMTIDVVALDLSARVKAGGLDLLAQGGSAMTLTTVKSYTMDSNFTNFESGWFFNAYGGSVEGSFVASRETRPDHVYSGSSSQRFQVVDKKGGAVDLIAQYPFVKGKTYHATMWMRADEPTPVQAYMRMDAPPWQPFTSATVTLNSTWQKIELEGAYVSDALGSLRVALLNASGTVWIDEVTISEVNKNDLAPFTTAPIPDTMFGMHVNQLGVHAKWPGLGTKMVRLWDTGTTWRDLEPANNVWDFHRIDMYVEYVLRNEPQANITYTMGMTPQWASSTPGTSAMYGMGAGGAPRDMNDWRDYVRTLARRYAGKIRYWELWNEPDYGPHFNGTVADLVEMARIAREELLAADPNNKLVSPGFTVGQGMGALDAFLASGGGQYADIIGFHWYYSTNPESIAPSIDNVRNTMKTYGVAAKPLWNTEGAFICNPATMNCATARPTAEESRSVNARAMLIMAAKGIQNFNFYFWESDEPFSKLVESDFTTATSSAVALTEARSWIAGASIIDAYRIEDSVYVLRLTRGTGNFVVLWAGRANTLVNLPAVWNVTQQRTIRGIEAPIAASRQLTLGIEPILLK